jgi:hypothetical protein
MARKVGKLVDILGESTDLLARKPVPLSSCYYPGAAMRTLDSSSQLSGLLSYTYHCETQPLQVDKTLKANNSHSSWSPKYYASPEPLLHVPID